MNPGRKPATNRVLSRRFTAGTPAEKVEFLGARLERLIKGLQLFLGYYELAPSDFRSEVKQFIDLAEIELREGLKALQSGARVRSSAPSSLNDEVGGAIHNEPPTAPAIADFTASKTDTALVDTSSDPLLSAQNSNLNSLGLNFDSMAQMAEVPEANDVEAILARLQSYGEALDHSDVEGRKVGKQPGRDARELILGFEVCRMDADPAEATTCSDTETQSGEASSENSNASRIAAANDATSLTTQFSAIVQVVPESAVSSGVVYSNPVEDGSPDSGGEGQGFDSVKTTNQTKGSTEEKSELLASKPEIGSGKHSNPNTARESKSEQGENSSPVNSISPDNLLEINALKDELNSMLSQFKSPGAVSSGT